MVELSIFYKRFVQFKELLKLKYPDLEVKFKNESTFMKIIGYALFFNKAFMTGYVTTIGSKVYFPSKELLENRASHSAIITLAHEVRHVHDFQKVGSLWFSLGYLFPQILAPLMLCLIPINWILALILFVVCLAPWPAYWRMKAELSGYTMTLFTANELMKELDISLEDRTNKLYQMAEDKNKHFTTFGYYLMWPFGVTDKLKTAAFHIVNEKLDGEIYKDIKEALVKSK